MTSTSAGYEMKEPEPPAQVAGGLLTYLQEIGGYRTLNETKNAHRAHPGASRRCGVRELPHREKPRPVSRSNCRGRGAALRAAQGQTAPSARPHRPQGPHRLLFWRPAWSCLIGRRLARGPGEAERPPLL